MASFRGFAVDFLKRALTEKSWTYRPNDPAFNHLPPLRLEFLRFLSDFTGIFYLFSPSR